MLGAHRLDHGVGVVHLHANDLDARRHCLDVVGHPRDQAATANGHKHGVQSRAGFAASLVAGFGRFVSAQGLHLTHDFHGHRALACDHVRVVKGMHKGQPFFFLQFHGMAIRI